MNGDKSLPIVTFLCRISPAFGCKKAISRVSKNEAIAHFRSVGPNHTYCVSVLLVVPVRQTAWLRCGNPLRKRKLAINPAVLFRSIAYIFVLDSRIFFTSTSIRNEMLRLRDLWRNPIYPSQHRCRDIPQVELYAKGWPYPPKIERIGNLVKPKR